MNDKKREQRKKILQLLKKEAPYGLSIRQISERVFGDPEPDRNRKDMIRRHLVNEPLIESYGNTRGRNFRYVSTVLDSDFTLKEIADAWVSCVDLYWRGSHGLSWWSSFQNCMMTNFPEIHDFLFPDEDRRHTNFNWNYDLSSLREDFIEHHGDEFVKMVGSKMPDWDGRIPIPDDGLEVETSFRRAKKQVSLNLNSVYDLMIKDIESWILGHWNHPEGYYEEPSYPNLIREEINQMLSDDISITREVVISLALDNLYRTIIEESPSLKELSEDDYEQHRFYHHY